MSDHTDHTDCNIGECPAATPEVTLEDRADQLDVIVKLLEAAERSAQNAVDAMVAYDIQSESVTRPVKNARDYCHAAVLSVRIEAKR